MPVSAFLSLSSAVILASGALAGGLAELGVSKKTAVFFLISAAALSGFELTVLDTVFISPACMLAAAAGTVLLFSKRRGTAGCTAPAPLPAVPSLIAVVLFGAALSPLFASNVPAARYCAGLAAASCVFIPSIRERGAAFVCAWSSVAASALAYLLPAPLGGAAFLTFSDSVLSAQTAGFLSILVLSSAFSRTVGRRSPADRTTV